MYPILYESSTAGTVAQHNGLGVLSDCISCQIEQKRNGSYELTMEYPKNGIHAGEIATRRIIKAKPNATDNPQLFRIDRIGKTMNGVFTVYGKHISYDLSGYTITSGTASTIQAACLLLQQAATGWTITTDKTSSGNFKIDTPASVRSYFGGKKGSILDIYGGELKYDNYTVQFKNNAGADRGVTIRYGKNLLELSQETASDNLYTHVLFFYKNEDTNELVLGTKVATGLSLDTERCLILDASSDYEEAPTTTQLTAKATDYIGTHNLTIPSNNITLDFVQSEELSNRVDLCDTVSIYYEALGITRTSVKCIRTKWDVIREKYIETEFGDAKTTLTDSIVEANRAITEKPTTTNMEKAIKNATQLITGNLGGFVVIHDSNGDGQPDEILIMDTDDITTAQKVWRWNKNGLGYSSTGYDGSYGLAATSDGAIVADFITAGTMAGDRIRTGLIASQNGQLLLNLDTGTITAPAITLNGEDVGDRLAELEQVSVVTNYALSNSGTNIPASFPLNAPTEPTEQQPYLWSRTIYTYADGQENTSYGVSVRGAKGQNGQDGKSFTVKGTYDTMADLIAAHPTGEEGDAYMVAGDLVVWNVDTNSWEDVGRIQGPSGFDGLWLAIENNDTGSNTNITYTAKLFKGVTDVTTTYNAVFAWQMVKESGVTEIAAGTPTVTVARDAADYGGTIRCICVAILTEEVLQDYGYNTITDYDGNDIQIIGTNTVRLTGDAAIYKPYAIESQFEVLQDEISSRVTQTEFNSLTDTVTTQGTQIQQNAQQILLKADTTTVNAGLNNKMGKDMSNRSSSILIDSGQIRFDSNSLVVNSSQFTLDAEGNATFGGNLSAATLIIGGTPTGIGTAISDAESDAIATAAADATNKANAAQTSAISTAASDATTKANNAKNSAISTAASDATTKANNAQTTAISTAKTYTDTGLATKVGNNEIRTKFAADTHSVTIESGTIMFKSNTLLVDSTQFTLDASGNATFKGNLSAATLDIGGTATNIGTAISNAETDAITAAAADATTKANNAKNSAISTAASDATTKANNAQSAAISAAASDATTKANNALTSSKTYTDNGLAGKVGNNEIRTKFAADTHSVTIESGTIAFNSNTLSVNADNFTLTAAGIATLKNMMAKRSFELIDENEVKRGYWKYVTSNEPHWAITNASGSELAEIWGNTYGGQLQLKTGTDARAQLLIESTGAARLKLNNADGDAMAQIVQYSSSNKSGRFLLYAPNNSAYVDITPTAPSINTQRFYLTTASLGFRTADNSTRATMAVGTNGGLVTCYNNDGNSVVNLFCGSSKQGEVYIGDGSETKIYLHGGTGNITCVDVTQTSSRKVKENIKPIEDTEKILELEAVSFDYKDKKSGTDRRGFIAEDVAEFLPNLVRPETEEAPAGLDYIGMIPYLQDLAKRQEKRITELEARIERLEKMIESRKGE